MDDQPEVKQPEEGFEGAVTEAQPIAQALLYEKNYLSYQADTMVMVYLMCAAATMKGIDMPARKLAFMATASEIYEKVQQSTIPEENRVN